MTLAAGGGALSLGVLPPSGLGLKPDNQDVGRDACPMAASPRS